MSWLDVLDQIILERLVLALRFSRFKRISVIIFLGEIYYLSNRLLSQLSSPKECSRQPTGKEMQKQKQTEMPCLKSGRIRTHLDFTRNMLRSVGRKWDEKH